VKAAASRLDVFEEFKMTQDDSIAGIQSRFVVVKRINVYLRIVWIGLGVTAACLGVLFGQLTAGPLRTSLLVMAGVVAVIHLVTWACPNCSRSFGLMMNVRFCPRCGVPVSRNAATRVPWDA
jgi:hypothetical protein